MTPQLHADSDTGGLQEPKVSCFPLAPILPIRRPDLEQRGLELTFGDDGKVLDLPSMLITTLGEHRALENVANLSGEVPYVNPHPDFKDSGTKTRMQAILLSVSY